MSTPCVLAVQQDSLISQVLASVLMSSKSELKVITYQAKDISGLVAETSELKPDVVILGESTPLADERFFGTTADEPSDIAGDRGWGRQQLAACLQQKR